MGCENFPSQHRFHFFFTVSQNPQPCLSTEATLAIWLKIHQQYGTTLKIYLNLTLEDVMK